MVSDAFLAISLVDMILHIKNLGVGYEAHVRLDLQLNWVHFKMGITATPPNIVCKCAKCRIPDTFRPLGEVNAADLEAWRLSLLSASPKVPVISLKMKKKLSRLIDAQKKFREIDPKLLSDIDFSSPIFNQLLDSKNIIADGLSIKAIRRLRKFLNRRIAIVVKMPDSSLTAVSGRLVKLNEVNGEFTLFRLEADSSESLALENDKDYVLGTFKIKLSFGKMVKTKADFEKNHSEGTWMKLPNKAAASSHTTRKKKTPTVIVTATDQAKPHRETDKTAGKKKKTIVQVEEFEPHTFEESTAPQSFWKSVPRTNASLPLAQRLRRKNQKDLGTQ
jgi:hypothetical protein